MAAQRPSFERRGATHFGHSHSPHTKRSRHHLAERAVEGTRSVLDGLHPEYSLAPALT